MSSDTDRTFDDGNAGPTKTAWVPMELKYIGHLGQLLQSGGGKLTQLAPDGPDVRKPPGK